MIDPVRVNFKAAFEKNGADFMRKYRREQVMHPTPDECLEIMREHLAAPTAPGVQPRKLGRPRKVKT